MTEFKEDAGQEVPAKTSDLRLSPALEAEIKAIQEIFAKAENQEERAKTMEPTNIGTPPEENPWDDCEPADDHGIELIYAEIADSQIQLSWILGGQNDE